jgi:hypothetical protein
MLQCYIVGIRVDRVRSQAQQKLKKTNTNKMKLVSQAR